MPTGPESRSGALGLLRTLALLSRMYWRKMPGRALVSLSGIALGVGLMVAVVSVNQAVLRTYDRLADTIEGRSLIEIRSVASAGIRTAWLSEVEKLDGVQLAVPVVEQRGYLFTDNSQASVTLRGVDAARTSLARPMQVVAGRHLAPGDREVVVLSAAAAASLGVGVGDAVSLLTTDGVDSLHVIGLDVADEAGGLVRDRTAIMPLGDAQAAFMLGRDVVTRIDVLATDPVHLGELKQRLQGLFGGVATIRMPADELRDLAAASRGMRFLLLLSGAMALVAAAFLVATNLFAAVEERGRDLVVLRAIGLPGRRAATWLLLESGCLGLVGSVVGAVAGAALATLLLDGLPSGLLGGVADAAASSFPVGLVLLLGVVTGTVVSVTAAWPLAARARSDAVLGVADPVLARSRSVPPGGKHRLATVAATVGIAGAVLLLAWPAGRALLARLETASLTDGQGQALGMTLLVLALGVAAVRSFPLLVNRIGAGVRHLSAPPLWLRLATDSMRRHSRRSGATAISLMITVTGLVGVYGAADSYSSSLTGWLDASVSWDLMVSAGPPGAGPTSPLPAVTSQVVAAVPGVSSALPERTVTVSSHGRAVPLMAFDAAAAVPSRTLRVEEMAPGLVGGVAEALLETKTVALSTALAARLGVAAGERVPLSTVSGDVEFLVVAVVEDPAADGAGTDAAAAYIDIGRFASAWSDTAVDEIVVRLDPQVDLDRASGAVAVAIRTWLAGSTSGVAPVLDPGIGTTRPSQGGASAADAPPSVPVQVVQAAAYREEVLDEMRDVFFVIRTLALLGVVVALAGLLNAILVGFWQLRQQLGLLKALGAPIELLTRTLAAEAALTTMAGGGAGVLLGTLLSLALLRGMDSYAGPLLVWSPPLQAYVVVATLLAVVAVVAASLLDNHARATPVQAVVRGE
ncbi:MAG TPA: ABC transporter permease [Trueperaceae bacterium]|nr:ABC transporter permease [Trueperaceae bacterium]